MAVINLNPNESVLLLIDLQPSFMKIIHESERVFQRSLFLAQVAHLMEIPILTSEQYPSRMGSTDERLLPHVTRLFSKMEFSALANDAFSSALKALNRSQVIVVGVETHICISQTCHGLKAQGYEAVVCPDAVSASTQDRHKLGMERLRDAGIIPAHTEAIAYEWMRTADDTRFKAMLKLVKESEF